MDLQSGSLTQLGEKQTSGNFDALLQPYQSNLPSTFVNSLSGPLPPEGNNFSGIDNKDYTALVAKASALPAPGSCTYWNQAEQALFRNVDVVPISQREAFYYLNGVETNAIGNRIPVATSIRSLN